MAKSLRSKWRRKCRAAKREKYEVKELARLKKTLGIVEDKPTDTIMNDISDITITLDANTVKEKIASKKTTMSEVKLDQEDDSDMDHEVVVQKDGKSKVYNTRTMRDQNGHYPAWLSQRKIKTLKNNNNKRKGNKIKKTKRKGKK